MVQDYTNMSVQDKLKLADERLEKLKGTDKYDAFKERVDAMHAKYEPEITKLGQNLEKAGYSRDITNDATWDYKNNRMGLGPAAADRIRHEADVIGRSKATGFISGATALTGSYMAGSVDAVKTSNVVRSATVDTAKGILQGARDTLAATVRQAGQKAVAEATQAAGGKIAELTASAAGNLAKGNAAAEAITHFGLTGEQAAENAKVATDAFKAAKTAQTELSAVKVGINTAGHNARVAAWNAGQKGLQTAAEQASQVAGGAVKAGRMAGLASGAKTFLKGNAASSFAIGGATSAIKGAIDLGGTIKATSGEGFGTAVKDTFTTKRGWKNLGLGFVGALRDVGNSMTFGAIENGDRTREKMTAAKGGEAPDLTGMSNFLATDKVPDTIFGIPVVSRREDYTEEDIAFFKEHPEAGGYYDMGEGTPDDGTVEGAPVQMDVPVKGPYPGTLNNPGNVRPGEVVYDGESGTSTARDGSLFLKFKTPQAGLDAMAQSVGQMIRVKIPKAYAKGEIPDARFNVENLIKVYAPSKDKNDVEDYIKFVSGKLGVDRKKELRTDDVKTMASMLEAMIRRDSGHPHSDWFENGNYMMAAKRMTVPVTKPRKKGAK